jgi:hypothetical protein
MNNHHIIPAEDVLRFVTAGKAAITIVSTRTNAHKTFRFRKSDPGGGGGYFIDCRLGDWTYAAWLAEPGGYANLRRCPQSHKPALKWLQAFLAGKASDASVAQAEFWHEGQCAACGRQLTDPVSIESGFGPVCREKLGVVA